MMEGKVGVFICHCGGNISDYVDVEKVKEAISGLPGVVVSTTTMFACSDAAQQEIIDSIEDEGLDGIVVASCSPKLHLHTFRGVAARAGLNPYRYVHVNIREQCSWAHRKDRDAATEKAVALIRAGVARALRSESLERFRVETRPSVLVVGAGISGLRSALALSEMGLSVTIVEREEEPGGFFRKVRNAYPGGLDGREVVDSLLSEVAARENITLFTGAQVVEKKGTVGDFQVKIRVSDGSTVTLLVGAVLLATGFEPYEPAPGEFGFGHPRVVRLPEFLELLDGGRGMSLLKDGDTVAFIYCVGSRGTKGCEEARPGDYCSRYCCGAAVHTACRLAEVFPGVSQYHLFRDMRTYGKLEALYEEASREGAVFLRFPGDSPPAVVPDGERLLVRSKDTLLGGEEVEIAADLVVLVTGMVPRENSGLVEVFKVPVGRDGFFNEVHPKLRPVETVIDGVFIVGAGQGPKTAQEAVASALAGSAKCASLLLKGYVELEPFVAEVDRDLCEWCGECEKVCPYGAIRQVHCEGKEVAEIVPALCKGGGSCVPACPKGAIDLAGFRDSQIRAMIDALAGGGA
ncbi:MAG: CoB--CoM heterodisulfide reductase iron-sulfur subunit A family protein [Deltaproteobacteria bacterium]|nr:MAG: CoB--CoM heterodisulfide reductase iron-sulfur subunit A family protein [Deltaproteobacteria bacterium]